LVLSFDEDTPEWLCERLLPTTIVKGADAKPEGVPEDEAALHIPGHQFADTVEFVPVVDDIHTTSLICSCRNHNSDNHGTTHLESPTAMPPAPVEPGAPGGSPV
jgi:bifunctional ADP-heptose synthase (sugar kinase/adenylyltransferase)